MDKAMQSMDLEKASLYVCYGKVKLTGKQDFGGDGQV